MKVHHSDHTNADRPLRDPAKVVSGEPITSGREGVGLFSS